MSAMVTERGTLKGSVLRWGSVPAGVRDSVANGLLEVARNGLLPEGSNELAWERIARSVRGMLRKRVIDLPSAEECHVVHGVVMEVIGALGAPDTVQHFDALSAERADKMREGVRSHSLSNYMSGSAPIVSFGDDGSMRVVAFEQKGGL